MGDENFSLEGLTVEEIKRAMAILQAKKIKAYAKRAALTIRIDEAKLASTDLTLAHFGLKLNTAEE